MTANYSLYMIDGEWLSQASNPSFEDLTDDIVLDQIYFKQSLIDWVFEHRTDVLRYLTNGEFGPPGGYAEWDGSDCFAGFTSPKATAEIARVLSQTSPEELMQAATWIEDEFRDSVAHCLKVYYPDLRQFIEKAVAEGHGVACIAIN